MNDAEALAAVEAGGRCQTNTTIHGMIEPNPELRKECAHNWRTVACNSDRDVIECSKCGWQRTCACDFDEEFA